jgi:hypothetical protein
MWSESILSGVLEEVRWKESGQNSAPRTLGLDRSTLRARMRKLTISSEAMLLEKRPVRWRREDRKTVIYDRRLNMTRFFQRLMAALQMLWKVIINKYQADG